MDESMDVNLGFLAETVSFLQRSGESQPRVLEVGEDGARVTKLVVGPGIAETLEFPLPEPKRQHRFATVEGFLSYLNSEHCVGPQWGKKEMPGRTGVVFAGPSMAEADLAYGEAVPESQRALLPYEPTPAHRALSALRTEKPVKEVWRILRTGCFEAFPSDLAAQVAMLRVMTQGKQQIVLDATGLGSKEKQSACRVTVGNSENVFHTDWSWTGSLWQCFEYPVEVAVRIELVESDKGLHLVFHLLDMEFAVLATQRALVEAISEGLPAHFRCFEGMA